MDLLSKEHVNYLLKRALEEVDSTEAIKIVAMNAAERFKLKDFDDIALGITYMIVLKYLSKFEASSVYIGGKLVGHEAPLFGRRMIKRKTGVMKLSRPHLGDTIIRISGCRAKFSAIELTNSLLTEEERLPIENGVIRAKEDVLHVAVIERYGKTGHMGGGSVRDLNFDFSGTMAYDMIHLKELEKRAEGGHILISKGKVRALLSLPIGGPMSDLGAYDAAGVEEKLKLTPKGLVDVEEKELPLQYWR